MKAYFGSKSCPKCNGKMDMIETHCPHCKIAIRDIINEENKRDLQPFLRFERYLQVPFYKQIIFFAVGCIGFFLLSILLSFIFQIAGVSMYGLTTQEELIDYLKRVDVNYWMNMALYMTLFVVIALCLWKKGWKEIARSFKRPSAVAIAFAGLGACLTINFIYNIITTSIFQAIGWNSPSVNNNEATLRMLSDVNFPLYIVVIGFLGPFVEEVTYRCGLFSFFSRIRRWLAYVVSGLIFGLIHFSWDFSSTQAIVTELVNLPTYIGAGLVMAFVYEKGGFAASFIMHSMNNLYAIIVNYVLGKINGQ